MMDEPDTELIKLRKRSKYDALEYAVLRLAAAEARAEKAEALLRRWMTAYPHAAMLGDDTRKHLEDTKP